jgi:hypothetical protein
MKSIVTTYPDFQALPKGVKQLLVTTETLYFQDAKPSAKPLTMGKPTWDVWTMPKPVVGHDPPASWPSP